MRGQPAHDRLEQVATRRFLAAVDVAQHLRARLVRQVAEARRDLGVRGRPFVGHAGRAGACVEAAHVLDGLLELRLGLRVTLQTHQAFERPEVALDVHLFALLSLEVQGAQVPLQGCLGAGVVQGQPSVDGQSVIQPSALHVDLRLQLLERGAVGLLAHQHRDLALGFPETPPVEQGPRQQETRLEVGGLPVDDATEEVDRLVDAILLQ